MSLWVWLVGYVLLFALLHLVLYYAYVRRDGETSLPASVTDGEHAGLQSAPRLDRARAHHDGADSLNADLEVDGETTACPHCGAPNEREPTFTYCRVCVSPLRR
ncbi:DUF7577 domain-containing protein [Natronosalvus rutilus]|uniref:DUF7577 domain-containing protein n=1 Tax=Natronosalvus rutilus TaxID=2953753 RepID=A0A9E7N9N8_9EURY|nr:hypothetical protein [Natronosalvus rutilus]UTF54374.1 hypothetical protein NGM29_03580 [Natronosalvus rutilus]